ncbi:MAG: carbohydrate ABC transporter permease [Hyphomonadaceae bacterium]|nr:carbohydrate ABC transporter permease [Hyphomonadaceae bacterium]MBC6412630.1 carbohydrate ABC transporter permease [Hyphomonadaceae bacterium]
MQNSIFSTAREFARRGVQYAVLLAVACAFIGPFLWLLSTAMKSGAENIFESPPQFIPKAPTLENFGRVFESLPFVTYFFNSAIVASVAVICNLLFCSLAAYPLARMSFAGKNAIFLILISTMMLPFQLLMIPLYSIAVTLGLNNSFFGLIIPHACTAFGIFLMRQAFLAVPHQLEESAHIEGVNRFQIWWYIMLPLVRPTLATLAVFTFIGVWGDFLWPLIILDDQSKYTLPLGVNKLAGTFGKDWRLVAAGAILSVIPTIAVFLFTQRFFISGALKGAVKG